MFIDINKETVMANGNGHNVGYVRVSSVGQNLDRQLDSIDLDKVFTEKASAKDAKRPVLLECLEYLREGDTLHIHSIDRLARNLMDLQNIVTKLSNKGVSVRFHKENLIFTGDDNPMSKLTLQLMGAFAEFERNIIKERQLEGIRIAQKKGTKFGRTKALTDNQVAEIKERIANGEQKKSLAEEYGISRQTLYSAIGQPV